MDWKTVCKAEGIDTSKLTPRLRHLESCVKRKGEGFILEFGVFNGKSLRKIEKVNPDGSHIAGFDSFEGLPEDWDRGADTYRSGHFSIAGIPNTVNPNTELVKGFFDQTLEPWKEVNSGKVGFLHIDSDLYSSCKYILSSLNDRIVKGTVILFDELIPLRDSAYEKYQNWQEHEWKAFNEWRREHNRSVEILSWGENYEIAYRVVR